MHIKTTLLCGIGLSFVLVACSPEAKVRAECPAGEATQVLDIEGADWNLLLFYGNRVGGCPIDDSIETYPMSIDVNGTEIDATLEGDELALGHICVGNQFVFNNGDEDGCIQFSDDGNSFAMRSFGDEVGEDEDFLGFAVGWRDNTPMPAAPDCQDLLNLYAAGGAEAFLECPPAPF